MKTIAVIPARYASTRMPGKPLADVLGKPMIYWVYKAARACPKLDDVLIATDDERIADACKTYDMRYIMTSPDHDTPTGRIWEVSTVEDADLYLQLMGDEPLVNPAAFDLILPDTLPDDPYYVAVLTNIMEHPADVIDFSNQKVVTNAAREILLISRSPIPYPKGTLDFEYEKVTGIQLYSKQALKFDRVPQRAETLTLTSRAQVSKHGSVKRITTLTDAEGKEVAMVDCRWIVASLAEGRILREPGWTVENFWNDTVEGELPLQLHKCKDGLTSAGEWTAHYSQCDLNGHLNNAFYLDLVCDALPLEVMRKGPVTFASINYHREIPMGETAEVFYAPSADGWYVVGKHNGQTSFECYLEVGKTNV